MSLQLNKTDIAPGSGLVYPVSSQIRGKYGILRRPRGTGSIPATLGASIDERERGGSLVVSDYHPELVSGVPLDVSVGSLGAHGALPDELLPWSFGPERRFIHRAPAALGAPQEGRHWLGERGRCQPSLCFR